MEGFECEELGTEMDPEGEPEAPHSACRRQCSASPLHTVRPSARAERPLQRKPGAAAPGAVFPQDENRVNTAPTGEHSPRPLTLSSAIFPRRVCCAGAAPPPQTTCTSFLRAEALPERFFFFERLEALS